MIFIEFPTAGEGGSPATSRPVCVRALQGMSITLRRPIYNPKLLVPGTDVAIEIPSIKTVLAESEYQFITSMAGDNFSEPLKVPQAAQWLQQYYSTDTTVLSPEPLAEGDTATSEEAGAGASPPSKQELFKQAVKAEEGQPQKPPSKVISCISSEVPIVQSFAYKGGKILHISNLLPINYAQLIGAQAQLIMTDG